MVAIAGAWYNGSYTPSKPIKPLKYALYNEHFLINVCTSCFSVSLVHDHYLVCGLYGCSTFTVHDHSRLRAVSLVHEHPRGRTQNILGASRTSNMDSTKSWNPESGIRKMKWWMQNAESGIWNYNTESEIFNGEIYDYTFVGIKENAVYKGSNVLRDSERQRMGERQRELFQTVQLADSPIKKR